MAAARTDVTALLADATRLITEARVMTPRTDVDNLLADATRLITEARVLLAQPPPDCGTIDVPAGADLQAAIDAARAGDILALDPEAVYTGNFVLRNKGSRAAGMILITTRDVLPVGRMTPDAAARLPRIQAGPGGGPAFATEPGAHHYSLTGLAFPPLAGGINEQVSLGDGSGAQTQIDQVPHDLVVDRCYFYGGDDGQKRAIGLNCGAAAISGCYIAGIRAFGQDSQAICGWNGPGPYLIEDNYLEAAGENILFGGADATIPDLVPSHITIRGNTVAKDVAWRGLVGWNIKNLLELKSAAHVEITGNIFEHCWADAQVGFALVLTVRNQDGQAPWSTVRDVRIENNCIRHVGAGINILALDDDLVLRPSVRMEHVEVLNNLFYDIDNAAWGGHDGWASGRLVQICDGPKGLVIAKNTMCYSSRNAPSTLNAALYFVTGAGQYTVEGLDVRDNILAEGEYGLIGDAAGVDVPMLDHFAPGWKFDRNVLIGGPNAGLYQHPPSTITSAQNAPVLNDDFSVGADFPPEAGVDLAALQAAIPNLDVSQ